MVRIASNFSNEMFRITPNYRNDLHWKDIEKQNWKNAMLSYDQAKHKDSLIYSPYGTDIVFSCKNGEKAFAHRMVLNSVPFIKKIFNNNENIQDAFGQTVVVLPDFEVVNIIACLSWIYSREIVGNDKNKSSYAQNVMTLKEIFGIEIETSSMNVAVHGTENFEGVTLIDNSESTEMVIEQGPTKEETYKSPSNTQMEASFCAIQSSATSASPAKTCREDAFTVPQNTIESNEFTMNSSMPAQMLCIEFEGIDDSTLPNIEQPRNEKSEQYENDQEKAEDAQFDKAIEKPENIQAKKDASMIKQKISQAGAVQLPIANTRLEKSKQKTCKSIKSSLLGNSPIQAKNNSEISPDEIINRHSFPNATTIKPRRASMRLNNRETKSIDDGFIQKSITISSKKHRNKGNRHHIAKNTEHKDQTLENTVAKR